jgi:2-hydroxychromene-2-carboxylate isomerase
MPGRTDRACPVLERRGRPALTGATNGTVRPTPATVGAILSDTGRTIPSTQQPRYTPKGMYQLRRRTWGCHVNHPQ